MPPLNRNRMELTGNPPNAVYRRFEGMREYELLIDQMIPLAQRIIRVFDKSLSNRYNSATRIDLLARFLRADRMNRLLIITHDVRSLSAACPRLIGLARQFSHALSIRETLRQARHAHDPFVIVDGSHYVHRFHHDHLRAAQGLHDAAGTRQLIDRFDEIAEYSGPPLAINVTGL